MMFSVGDFFAFYYLQTLFEQRPVNDQGMKLAGLAATYAFLLTSAIYFFAPINEGITFYTNQIPTWL